jgi:hypothetical protein
MASAEVNKRQSAGGKLASGGNRRRRASKKSAARVPRGMQRVLRKRSAARFRQRLPRMFAPLLLLSACRQRERMAATFQPPP